MSDKTNNAKTVNEHTTDAAKAVASRARDLYKKGSGRHVIFRRNDGTKLFEMNLALTVIITLLMLLFAGWLLVLTLIGGYLMKIRLEVIREVDDKATIEFPEE
jgi:hypothetical protein